MTEPLTDTPLAKESGEYHERLNNILRMASGIKQRLYRVHPESRNIFRMYAEQIELDIAELKERSRTNRKARKQEAGVAHE